VKKPSVMTLKRKLDRLMSEMVRRRDAGKPCISCGKRTLLQAGHFVKRKPLPTRWHPFNVNGECSGCNGFDSGHLLGYLDGLNERYGHGVARKLIDLSRVRWKVLPDQLVRLIDATDNPEEYARIWFDIQNEFAPGFELAKQAEAR